MDILSDPINLLLLIAAITVLWWLKSVLGQRTGYERPSQPVEIITPGASPASPPAQSVELIDDEWRNYALPGSALATSLEAVKNAQSNFSFSHFLSGAKQAHEIVLTAFANGDKKTLKELLNKTVYDTFEKVIDENDSLGNTNVFKFVGVTAATIKTADLDKNIAAIGVNFTSEIISATLNSKKEVISGDEKTVSVLNERWIFERDLNSKDPNWKLAATHDPASGET